MQYKDLNLKAIREKHNLDFAHFTYGKGQCSCCYSPSDMSARYWKDGIVKPITEKYSYILFKNANNGSGIKKRTDTIGDLLFIEWRCSEEQLLGVCKDLQEQLGSGYIVFVPQSRCFTIVVTKSDNREDNKYLHDKDFRAVSEYKGDNHEETR